MGDAGVASLLKALSMGEGFQCFIVVAPFRTPGCPVTWDSEHALTEKLGRHTLLVPPSHPAFPHDAETLMAGLLFPAHPESPVLLNLLDQTEEEETFWRKFFQLLNERRNILIQAMQCPLIFLLSEGLAGLLSAEAPDLWSIRSQVLMLPKSPQTPDAASTLDLEPFSLMSENGNFVPSLSLARQVMERYPDSLKALQGLASALQTSALYDWNSGRKDQALLDLQESVALHRQIAKRAPGLTTDLVQSLGMLAAHFPEQEQSPDAAAEAIALYSSLNEGQKALLGVDFLARMGGVLNKR